MIFNFRIVSDEVDNFKREISVDADDTFLRFKDAICDSVGFDKNQMCSFFLCDNHWEKEREITLEDMGSDAGQDVWLMDESVLSDSIDDEGQRLIFTFDYMTDRSLFIELKKITTGSNLKDPICTMSVGEPPTQSIDIDEFEANINIKASHAIGDDVEIDEDFYGDAQYNDDEFDAAGFDEMNFDQ